MPRKDPSPSDPAMSGFPNHGDPYEDDPDEGDPTPEPVDPPEPQETATEKRLREMQERMDRQERELEQLRRVTPPPQPKEPVPPSNPPSVLDDADERLFREPKKFLADYGNEVANRVTEQVTKSLTSQYQRDRGTQKFWEDFYGKHPDLKQDHDLVEVTLNSNLAEMSTMRVPEAMNRLADLTRERLLRYAGGATKPRSPRARAEGAAPPTPPKEGPKAEENQILSLTEILKARRENRRKRASGV